MKRDVRLVAGSHVARILLNERGLTIAELLMAAFIGLVVLGASWGAVAVQGRSAVYQAGLADAQSTGRGTGTLLLQDLRMAGFGMLGVSPDEDLPPIEYDESGGTTTLTLRGAFNNVQTTLQIGAAPGATTLTVNPPANGTFVTGEHVLVDSGLDSEVKTITSVSTVGGNLTIGLDSSLDHQYPVGPNVTQIEKIIYTWEDDLLQRDGQVVADNAMEFDLQFVDQDGTVTPAPGDNLRSVILAVVAGDPSPLPDIPVAQSTVETEVNVRNLTFRFDLS
ncbi:MAG: hypothetical protein P8R42_03420 [Candidatus Binatia bacterium]|nr:hypothetical protein [Candidatus Binatia bacterium]